MNNHNTDNAVIAFFAGAALHAAALGVAFAAGVYHVPQVAPLALFLVVIGSFCVISSTRGAS